MKPVRIYTNVPMQSGSNYTWVLWLDIVAAGLFLIFKIVEALC